MPQEIETKVINPTQFSAIINSLTVGLMVFDGENRLFLSNKKVEEFFGVRNEEILGKKIEEFIQFPLLKNLFFLLGREIKEVLKKELEISFNLILEISVIPIFIDSNSKGKLIVLHDISREKMIDKIKSEFITIASHQLRTPLSAIRWTFENLLKEGLGKLTAEQKKIIQEGIISCQRMTQVLNIFLDTARIEEGRYLRKFTFCNIEKIIEEIIKSYQDEIQKKEIKFEFQILNPKLPKVKIDPEPMTLVIQSLLDNAIRYTPEGGIVSMNLKLAEKEIVFSIQDTGIGIKENEKENVFKKFFRGSNALRINPEGNGLNLFIAKNIIEAHGGKIWFESEEKRGTTFYFTLPIT